MRAFDILTRSALSTSILALAATALSTPALAQDDTAQPPVDEAAQDEATAETAAESAEDEGQIFITGSRIPRANFDTPQPAVVLGSEQIELRGYTNLGEALDELPAFGVPGNNPVGAQSGAFGSGQTFVNFFGLGDQRTLTVVNARRFVSSNTASIFGPTGNGSQVDFSVIPTLVVDRVETIAVGGAPIYGSDAIAGTVNIITRRTYDGIMVDVQAGVSELGDAAEYRIGGIAGFNFAGGRGNIVIAAEYNHGDGLVGEHRPRSGLGRFFTTCLPGSEFDQCLIDDRRIPSLSESGVPLVSDFIPLTAEQAVDFGGFQPSVLDDQGRPLTFTPAGGLAPIDFGTATGNLINFDGGSGFVLPENLLTQTRRYLGTALAQYQVTDDIRVFGEFWYANSRGRQLRDQPVYNTALFGGAGDPDGNLIISIDNPFLSPAARAVIVNSINTNPSSDQNSGGGPQDYFYLGRANTDIQPSDGASTVELWRVVGGVDGDFQLFGRAMSFELVGVYGKSTTRGRERVLVQQNFENALNAVVDTGGNIVCAPGAVNAPIPTISSQCFPINPFGVGSSRVDLQACKLEYSIVSPK